MGICGKTEKEAAQTSLHEYRLLVEGYEKKQHTAWEVARWQIYHDILLSPNLKQHMKPASATAFIRFPWEPDTAEGITAESVRVTDEQTAELNRLFNIEA